MFGSLINNDKIAKLFKINNNINSKICCKMAKHDENKDLRLISRIAKIDYSNKTIQAPKSAIIGNKTLGRIDYLTHYCGWTFIYNNDVRINVKYINSNEDTTIKRKREAKKIAKENILNNKKKR